MKRSEQNEILNRLTAEMDLAELKRSSLESGLSALRQRRQRRRAHRAWALAILPVLLAGALLVDRSVGILRPKTPPTQHISAATGAGSQDSGARLISDEELFALFPNRALALVGKPGHQELIFLDQGATSEPGITR